MAGLAGLRKQSDQSIGRKTLSHICHLNLSYQGRSVTPASDHRHRTHAELHGFIIMSRRLDLCLCVWNITAAFHRTGF